MKKVLLADDAHMQRTNLKMDISGLEFNILQAENGIKGLEVIKENSDIDLIISDGHMPEMNGLEMIEKMNEHIGDKESRPIVLMITTESISELKEKSNGLGIKAWIAKPYSKDR